eukprot:SAG11_NODE_9151_length_938_cov_1.045292_1_plen_207_part_01
MFRDNTVTTALTAARLDRNGMPDLETQLGGAWTKTSAAALLSRALVRIPSTYAVDTTEAVRLSGGSLALDAVADPSASYYFRFDFCRDASAFKTGGFVVKHCSTAAADSPAFWQVDFPSGGANVVRLSSCVKGKTTAVGTGDLTLKGKHDPNKTWYRIVIRNSVSSFTCLIVARDFGGKVVGDDDVILSQAGSHDRAAGGGSAPKLM